MKIDIRRTIRFSLLAFSGAILGLGQVSVLTQHNDNARSGQNLNETILNTSNVNQNSFGKLFSRTVDGFIYAQPLYVPGLTIQGATHNVVYVATQHNSVYAFDADDPEAAAPLWQVNVGTPVPSQDICILTGDTNPADCPYYDISPEIGISSTPAIDPVAGIIYVVNRSKNTVNSTYHDYIHALNLTTGAEELGGPVEITGQVSGTAPGSQGGVLTFDPAYHHQRPSLLLQNGILYLAFGSVGDIGTWHGWVMSYNASTLQQVAIFGVAPNGSDGGIWSAGQGLVGDSSGSVYLMAGNGDFDANVAGGKDYGDSFVKFSGSSLAVADYFTPSNQGTLNADNTDLGSGGPMLMPGTSLLVGMGKDGIFRVVNTGDMGGYNSSVDNDVQEFTATPNPFYSSPIYWDSPNNGPVVYIWGAADYPKAFAFTGSKFNTTPVTQGTIQNSTGESNAAPLSISANGSQQGSGILWAGASLSQWASGVQIPGVLRAFDATNLATELWDSTQNLTRDDVGNFAKFNPPTIANGKVYVGSFSGQLQVYGLNPPPFQGIQFVQVASATPQSTTATVSLAYPGVQTLSDLNVVIVGWNDTTATVQSVTDSHGNTYALAAGPISGTGLSQAIYYAKNITGGSGNTVTVTFNQAATKPDVRILEYSGVDTASPLDVSAGASGNGNVADSGFATTTAANELVIGGSMAHSNTTIMAGAPFTPRVITTTDSDVAEDRLVNVAGSYHSWAPLNTSGAWVMQMATFRSIVSGTAPIVSSVSPNSGLPAGGTAVTITGTNFASGATVRFGSAAATNVVVVNNGTITATTPAGTAGAVTVTVTNPNAQSGSLTNGFTYSSQPGPTVSSVSPNNGPVAGGTAVTITGTNFAAGATVKFGSTAATNVVVVSSTSITATTPAGSAGAVTVTVTVNGQSGSLTNGFTYTGSIAIAFSQLASATPQTATASVPVTYPAAQTAGDLNVVVVGWNDNTSTVQSVKDSAGNTYTLAVGPTVGTGLEQSIYYAANIVGGSNTVTVTFSQAAAYPDIRILEYRGVTALDVIAGASGSSTAANSGAATTTVANELIFGANTVATGNGTVGSGFTSRIITTPDGDLAEDKIVTTAGSNSATATLSGSGPWVMQMATFAAVSGPVPTVSSISPTSGSTVGGTAVTITGTNFVTGATVTVGGTAATNVVVVSSTSITATTPTGTAGAVTVTVTNPGGQSGSLTSAFTYIAPPTVSSISPTSGTTAGGTAVTITGTNFVAGATVTFGGTAATNVVVVSGISITATTPAGTAGAVTVTVTNSSGLSGSLASGFTYVAPPTVSSVSPNSGTTAGGTAVTITGTNFVAGATVTFGSAAATNVVVVNSTTLTATTPAGTAGAVTVTVSVSGLSGSLTSGYTYIVTPTISSVSPNSGTTAGGTAVTITGTNFASGATVKFGSTAATNVVVVSSTSITATTPAGTAGAATVTVTNSSGLSGNLANGFTYVAPPTVSSVSPNSGSTGGGTAVTITGTNFVTGATVTFGSAAATNVVVVNSTTITATTPAGTAGAVTVTVSVSGLSGSLASGYTYVVAPSVSSVSPNAGPAAGGTAVTITGTNFASGATVKFGSVAATNVVVVSSTSITATTPAGSAGAVTVTVTVNSQSGSLANGYTYVVVPTVSSVSPNSGSTAGGTAVTITGTNFASGATVTFGSAAATNVVVVSGTSITATTPAGAAGAVTVTVTNIGSQSGSLASGYTYVATPTVSSVSPNNGPVAGGTAVTITGTNFAAGATVKFGSTAATNVVVVSSTSITATTPAGSAGAVTVTVTVNGQSGSLTNGFTYTGSIAIAFSQLASATPQTATASVPVTYPAAQTAGDLNVVVVGWNDNTSTVQSVKDSAGNTYTLAVGPTVGTGLEQSIYYAANIVGGSNTVTVTFSQAAAYPDIRILEYRGVTALDVIAGASGSSTAANSGAATTTVANELIFGANTVATGNGTVGSGFTSRIITTPDGDLAEDKIVTTAGSNSATATLSGSGPWVMQMATFAAVSGPVPTVSSISPTSGSTVGGTAVTITGTNFVTGATVTVGGTAATNVVVVSSTSITATTPTGTAGAVTVTVTNPGGQSGSLTSAFTYIAPPTVSSISPTSGTTAGGTAVTITGTNFVAGATVTFGGTAATNVVVVSGISITATTPAGTAGAVTVTVTNSSGLSGSLASGFTYVAPPTVSSVSPNSGTTAGGTAVTITGTNFVAGATVTFGSAAATNVVVVNSTTLTATTPAGTAGAVTVTVSVSGLSGSLTSGYTYIVTGAPSAPGNFVSALAGTSVPTYVAGQEYYNATPGTSFTSAPFNSTGADLLIMYLGCHNHTVFTITDNFGNTWLPLAGPAYKVGNAYFPMEGEFFYVPNAKTGAGHTVTVMLSLTEPLVMSIAALSGDNVYSPIDAYTSINGDSGTLAKYVTSNPLTTSQPNDLLLGIVKGFGNNTYAAGAGFTAQAAATGLNFGAETATAAVAGNYNASFTASVSDFWQSVIAAIAPKPTQTVLSWTASTGGIIANYLVERCAGVGCSSFSQIASVSGSTLTFTDATISAGTVYSYRVRAESSGIFGPYSMVQAVSPIIPQVVSGFAATPTGILNWNPSAENGGSISQYSVERCTGVGCSSFSQIATTGSTSYVDTSAATGTTYNYRVRAQDSNGFYGPYSVITTATTPAYFDNAGDGGNNGGATTSLSYSYKVGANSNRLLLVNLVGDTTADDITSVKYAGVSMTLVAKVQTPSDRWHYLYYLLAPASGTNNLVIAAASAHYLISDAASWYNITQSGPVAFTTNTVASGVSITTSLPASSNNVIVAESIWGYTGVLPDNGSTPLIVDAAFDGLGIFSSVPSPVTQAFPASMTNTWGGQSSASTILASFAIASNGTAGITYDDSADGGNNGGTTTSLTYSYKVGTGASRLLVVNLIGDSTVDDITSVTYAGAAMTLLGKIQAPSNNNWQYLYYLLNPANGTNNVIVTAGSKHYLISEAASWSNVRQSAQPDAVTTNTTPTASTSMTTSLTTVAAGSLVVQGLWSYGHLKEGVGATQILVDAAIGGAGIFVSSGSPVSPAGNVTMTTVSDGTQSSGVVMASFAPAP